MASMYRQIEEQKKQIAAKDHLLVMADAQARRYSNMGHLKGMVDRLEAQVAEHVSELVKYKLENQDLKETAANIKKENEMLESEIQSSKQVHEGLLNMYEAANRQNQIKDNLIQS